MATNGAAALGTPTAGPAHLAEGLREGDDIGRRHIEGSGHVTPSHQQQSSDGVAGMQELEARIETHDSRHDLEREVARDMAVHACAHQVGQPECRDNHIGPAARQPTNVAFDLDGIFAEAGARLGAWRHVLGEPSRVSRGCPVHRDRTLHDQFPEGVRPLACGEQLHRADDIDLLHRGASTGTSGRSHHGKVNDSVDPTRGDHLCNNGIADVGAYEIGQTDVVARRDHV